MQAAPVNMGQVALSKAYVQGHDMCLALAFYLRNNMLNKARVLNYSQKHLHLTGAGAKRD